MTRRSDLTLDQYIAWDHDLFRQFEEYEAKEKVNAQLEAEAEAEEEAQRTIRLAS